MLYRPRHFTMILLLASAALGICAASERAVMVTLEGGSRVMAIVEIPALWKVRTQGGDVEYETKLLNRVRFGPRVDPNAENEAVVALGDLQSPDFATREKALDALKKIGRSGARPLREAAASGDVENARRARTLMAELGIEKDTDPPPDTFEPINGKSLFGELAAAEFTLRTRWGKLQVPIEAINSFEFMQAEAETAKLHQELTAAPLAANEISLTPSDVHSVSGAARRWDPLTEFSGDQFEMMVWMNETKERTLSMDKIPAPKNSKIKAGAATVWAETKPGDRLEDAYAEKGIRMRAVNEKSTVEVSNNALRSVSSGRSAVVKNSDVEFTFTLPHDSPKHAGAGVFFAGAIVRADSPGDVGIAAYDSTGRLLGQVFNEAGNPRNVPNARISQYEEFLGLRSELPIARLRIFRSGSLKEKNEDLFFDDLVFDRPVPSDLRAGECRIETTRGELLAGTPLKGKANQIIVKLAWLGAKSDALTLPMAEIQRYEPARGFKTPDKPVQDDEKKEKRDRRLLRAITPHAIFLQSGETFRARLVSMNQTSALFLLARGVEITLPRESLKRIDLLPEIQEPTAPDAPPPPVVPVEDKPGVLLKMKAGPGAPGAPPPPEEIKDPAHNPAQGTDRIDDAEIAGVDPKNWMLILKDENGNDSEVGMPGVRSLIFPRDKNAAQNNQKRAWALTLREGSRFEIDLQQIRPDAIHANMAGGQVVLPSDVVESVERVK